MLENYTMSSAATAGGLHGFGRAWCRRFRRYTWPHGLQLSTLQTMAWLASLSVLGVFMAIPLKRQLVNVDKLPFPSGLAAAETLRSIHTTGKRGDGQGLLAVCRHRRGGVVKICVELGLVRSRRLPLVPTGARGRKLLERTTSFGFEGSLIMVGVGALMGIRVAAFVAAGRRPLFRHHRAQSLSTAASSRRSRLRTQRHQHLDVVARHGD